MAVKRVCIALFYPAAKSFAFSGMNAEEAKKHVDAIGKAGFFVEGLLQKVLEYRVELDGLIEKRVGAGGVGADADQVA